MKPDAYPRLFGTGPEGSVRYDLPRLRLFDRSGRPIFSVNFYLKDLATFLAKAVGSRASPWKAARCRRSSRILAGNRGSHWRGAISPTEISPS